MRGNILLVDDDQAVREMALDFLTSLNHHVEDFEDPEMALQFLSAKPHFFDLIITDLKMPKISGIELLKHTQKINSEIPVIIFTAFGTIDTAIEATKLGAYSYLTKPFKLDEFELCINRALAFKNLKDQNRDLKRHISNQALTFGMVGKSKAIQEIFNLISTVATASANVLINGESGTGKELVAKALHTHSERRNKVFIPVNCSAIPDTLIESELFGHIKGAFTGAISDKKGLFEEADGGTIFLDEIGDLNVTLQSKLLRTIQDKEIRPVGSNQTKKIDVRIISATHKNLKKAIEQENFREDLFYRLSVIPIRLPSLRERIEDIPLLAEHFLKKANLVNNRKIKGFTEDAITKLMSYRWDGNIRELENVIERLVILSKTDYISPEQIPDENSASPDTFLYRNSGYWPTLEEIENKYMRLVLEKTGGNKEKASQILGINRRTLYRKEL